VCSQDAATFAAWEVDAVKGDWCDAKDLDIQNTTLWMAAELNATGRPMWFNFHCKGFIDPFSGWCAQAGDSARVAGDHHDEWSSTSKIIEGLAYMGAHAGLQPDGAASVWWPDWDFLMTGGQACNSTDNVTTHCPGQTDVEYRTEFSFWALASSILLFSTDPRALSPIMAEVLLNTELLAANQDAATRPGMGVVRLATVACAPAQLAPCELWHRAPGADGAHYVLLYNPNDLAGGPGSGPNVTITLDLGAVPGLPAGASVRVRDLWAHADLPTATGAVVAGGVQPHEARALRLAPVAAGA
jgi:alpha-galactosidase